MQYIVDTSKKRSKISTIVDSLYKNVKYTVSTTKLIFLVAVILRIIVTEETTLCRDRFITKKDSISVIPK